MSAGTQSSLLQRGLQFLEENDEKRAGMWLVWLFLILVRWMVGLHSYSGEHTPPMFGDYEAQRHWMEITINLPISGWYFNTTSNDLLYWGLDYPPLTAYVSYLFGRAASVMEPAMVELTNSRGYESAASKVFMRSSVLLCDIALFIPAILYMARALYGNEQWRRRTTFVLLILLQPAILLIDHGHFQGHEFLGSICYCLALNFKQMALYYAPSFGVFLLARCLYRKMCVLHLLKLAVAVIATFALMWSPFCAYPSQEETCLSTIAQVVQRIFPFGRGLFEDKVANFWCIVDFVLKIRRHVTPALQMRLCMYFLLNKDGLVLPYIVLQLAYVGVAVAPFLTSGTSKHLHVQQSDVAPGYKQDGSAHPLFRAYVMLSLLGIIVIHAAQVWITPPARYPHIHDYVFAAYSCGHFLLVLGYLTYWQWTAGTQCKTKKE
ncbi:dolichyl pyrophosphate Man9GlcNAc2 alpha-1 [Phytophthora nicotianae]|uniref:Alpha-1,3-glucosyltransferase n=1 Tax=Phytophthora nicotianae TaxID=4792 RepID=A0A0W8BY30_PHYNI|nr:dolichyl pyrophosphate Man9GlcNAc2 alpha-1 [Phytophthora nicotianae]